GLGGLRRKPRDEDCVLAAALHCLRDADDLLRRFARAVNHLGRALAHLAVQIHLRVADILERLGLDAQQRVVHIHFAALYGLQYLFDFTVHYRTSRSSTTALYVFLSSERIS